MALRLLFLRTGKWLKASTATVLISILLTALTTSASGPLYGNLQKRLIADGFNPALVKSIYENPRAKVEIEVVAGNLVRSEATLNYDQFLSSYAVHRAERYLKRYGQTLEEVKLSFGVEPEVAVVDLVEECDGAVRCVGPLDADVGAGVFRYAAIFSEGKIVGGQGVVDLAGQGLVSVRFGLAAFRDEEGCWALPCVDVDEEGGTELAHPFLEGTGLWGFVMFPVHP